MEATTSTTEALAGFVGVPVEQLADLSHEQRDYLIESLIMVKQPETGLPVPLISNPMQREILYSLEDREITVKWRRGGLTSIYVGIAWINILTKPGWSVELFAHDWATAKAIFDDVICYQYDHIDPRFKPAATKRGSYYIEFGDVGSKFYVGTAGAGEKTAEEKGQARTINELICTEFARYHHAETFFHTVSNCVPVRGGKIRIDSTPRGQNSFYARFNRAMNGVGGFRGRFFAWWYGTDCFLELDPDEDLDDLHGGGPISDVEDALGEGNPHWDERRGRDKLTPEQIKWRRWKIDTIQPLGSLSALDRFRVEYPEDPETCFLASGRPVFMHSYLTVKGELRDRARDEILLDDEGSPILDQFGQEQKTGEKHSHSIGVDTSTGDASGHPAGIVVLDLDVTPAEQVFEWIGWLPTDSLAELVVSTQELFPGLIIVERNTPGDSVLQLLRRWHVPHVYKHKEKELRENMTQEVKSKPGFPMSNVTKPRIFNALEQALRVGDLIISGRETVLDLKGMQYNDDDLIEYMSPYEKGERGIETHGELAIAAALSWEGRKRTGVGIA